MAGSMKQHLHRAEQVLTLLEARGEARHPRQGGADEEGEERGQGRDGQQGAEGELDLGRAVAEAGELTEQVTRGESRASRFSVAAIIEVAQTAKIFPRWRPSRGMGRRRVVSAVLRSFSPAVRSTAGKNAPSTHITTQAASGGGARARGRPRPCWG